MELSRASRLLLSLLLSFFAATSARGNETDRLSLLELKENIIDPLGALNAWNESKHFCEWPGIICGRRHRRVTGLFIDSSRLGGRLSPFIGNLSFLRILDLENNTFTHQIPEEIGRLNRLQILRLHNNSFNGTIPTNLSRCLNLHELLLFNNKLGGEIPSEIGSLRNLKVLDLYHNDLHGEIPSSVANLSDTLNQLDVGYNHLSGHIPRSLGMLRMMIGLYLGHNKFCGTVPSSIYNLSFVQTFSFEMNELHGELPSHLLLPNLETFLFHQNQFSGSFPDISNASNLVNFEISANNLTGIVPKFSNIPNLTILVISRNNLGSESDDDLDFLPSLANCTNLEVLGIEENNFGGELSETVGNLSTKLWRMTFGSNRIEGRLPSVIENLMSLEVLDFEDNQVFGPIPASISKLQKLSYLYLNKNKFSGSIPSSFGNLTLLIQLYLGSNYLQGVVPSSLGKCNKLEVLSIAVNNLTGLIPKEMVGLSSLSRFLDLSDNHFTGSIPNEVGQLVNLGVVDLSNNKLSGEIPESLGMCTVLEYLSLAGNSLQGSIPKSFRGLKGLIAINLSHNNLSGKLPTYLESFRLQELELAFNNFEGEVPTKGIFANASVISLEGNPRLCGGTADLGLPKCPSKLSNKHKQSFVLIVSVVCGLFGMLVLALLLWFLYWTKRRATRSIVGLPVGVSFLEVSYADLLKATNGFCAENLIGKGSFGYVYKENIPAQNNTLTVAVKVLNLQVSKALKSFISECQILERVKHRNIVKLVTVCSSIDFQGNDFKALLYEFMINGSLEEWLHPRLAQSSEQGRRLDFIQRLNIAIDVANSLDHLHNNSHALIVHSDLKPSNILLDGDMSARVGDFGLARFLEDPSRLFSLDQSMISLGIRGSIGYIAPEYSMGRELSRAGDVYSYGILILEMLTGKRPTDEMFKDSFNLHNFVKRSLPERLSQVVDSALLVRVDQVEERHVNNVGSSEICPVEEEGFWKCLESIFKIGVSCSEERPNERMNISEAVKELQHVKIAYTSN